MIVCPDYTGYARFGVSMLAISTTVFHATASHWLFESIFAGLHVAMAAVRAVLAAARIVKLLIAMFGHALAVPGSAGSAVLAVALPALKPRVGRRQPGEPGSAGRAMPLGLALLAGVGSLGAANLAAGAGLAHFAVAIAAIPIVCAAAWAIFQSAAGRAD